MSNLHRFDERKGVIRLLLTLHRMYQPFSRLELFNELRKVGLGRTAAYKVIETLKSLGLIEVYDQNYKGKRVTITQISEKGIKVAEKLEEIESILDSS